nr:pilin [Amycolatopsis sp. RTGN1]
MPEAPTSPLRRSRRWVLLAGVLIASALLLGGSAAHAETVQYVALAQSVDQVLSNIRAWIMGILAGVALVFLSIGGLRYLMASGDPGEIEKAKGSFKASGVGFGLAALAPIVVEILKTIVGGV